MKNLKLHPILAYQVGPLSKLLKHANQDNDAASFWWLHDESKTAALQLCLKGKVQADGAIIIIKGDAAANSAYKLLCSAGLLTPLKPVVQRKPSPGQTYVMMRPGDPWHACHVTILAHTRPFKINGNPYFDCYLPKPWRKVAKAKQTETRPVRLSELW